MKIQIALICLGFGLVTNLYAQKASNSNKEAKILIQEMVDKVGNYDYLKSLKDVEFTYTFFSPTSKTKDVSIERYIFNSEVSWAKYLEHNVYVFPKEKGDVIQWFDGKKETFAKVNSIGVKDEKDLDKVRFLRKANYYWFTMMPKLLDKGLIYELLPVRIENGINYKIVKVGFNQGVGDVQDDFVLYFNPKTKLVDKFLFTVKGSRLPSVLLMKIKYETVNGYTFMAKRQVIPADWEGNEKGPVLFEQTTTKVKFNNGFLREALLTK